MPNSPLRADSIADVREFLKKLLPESTLADAEVNPAYEPLLLLRTNHSIAAFAFANGDVPKSFGVLYEGFKNHYIKQEGQWDALDLAFVFCVRPGLPQIDDFCSATETDIYFCRKFVVQLSASLGESLARLPFLPLTPVQGQSLRPPSAQTFLQQCKMPALLAKFLVVPRERSPEGIVEDCTTGKFGEPQTVTSESTTPVVQQESPDEPVRIASLEIENFRAYRKPQSFSLGADVTILYGPNGFGKTSFFDAIDFAVTGGIGRIDSRRQSDFEKTARHLDCGSEESTVSLTFRCKDGPRKITRSVSDRKHALLDGRASDRKAILSELTGSNIPATDRVENFVNLFRASHLFSQEQQELTKDFQNDCTLSAEIVSRMLAFEDYTNAVNKANRVRDVIQAIIGECTDTIRTTTAQIVADNLELDRLGQTAKEHANLETLSAEIDSIREKLKSVGVAVSKEQVDVSIVRGWRALLASRYTECQSLTARLSLLAKELAGVHRVKEELAKTQAQLELQDQAFKLADEKRIGCEIAVQRIEQRLAEVTAKRIEAQSRADMFEWMQGTQTILVDLLSQQRDLEAKVRLAGKVLFESQTAEDKAVAEVRSLETTATMTTERMESRQREIASLQALRQSLVSWETNKLRIATIWQTEKSHNEDLERLEKEALECASLLAELKAEETRLARQIAEADKSKSELQSLVAQLQPYVQEGTCPLCGVDHGSKDRLLADIQSNIAADIVIGTRENLEGVKEKSRQLFERMTVGKEKQGTLVTGIATLKTERNTLEALSSQFVAEALKASIALEGQLSPAEQIDNLVSKLKAETNVLEGQLKEMLVKSEGAKAIVANAKIAVSGNQANVAATTSSLAHVQAEINKIRTDPRLIGMTFDIDPAQLSELRRLNLEHLSAFTSEAGRAEAEANERRPQLSMLRQESISIRTQMAMLRSQIANHQRAINQVVVRTDEAGLPADSSEQSVLSLVEEQTRVQVQLLALQDSTSSLELGMDAATTAAALTTLKNAVRSKEREITAMTAKRDRHLPWRKYFEEISRLVTSQQNDAIANFTHEYGPRASVIQRRLRSVYGFDDIEIKNQESSISVRVMRHGEELRPTDYFSQSQQQTLLLGLFLTACSSQTWSAFSAVFLDDPVTHFDDLNTYAFLDLIIGLLQSDVESRQFIISTCDEKLLQLARQKFRHLGGRAKFYRFTSIGVGGPSVEESL